MAEIMVTLVTGGIVATVAIGGACLAIYLFGDNGSH